jgi:hypothetical protein
MNKLAKVPIFLAVLLAMLFLPHLAPGVEFSAQMLTKDRDAVVPGRIYVKDGKMRQEFLDAGGQSITILRQDKKVVWVIIPGDRTYYEEPLRFTWPGQFLQIPPLALQKRRVGQENIAGYDTEKYEVTLRGKDGLIKQTFWLAPRLGVPIKMAGEKNFSVEYRNIREGGVADRLFELPQGYQKLTKPTGLK